MATRDESNDAGSLPDQETLTGDAGSKALSKPAGSSPLSKLRLPVLLAILLLLMFAAWYDYKVARPGVNDAFDIVTRLHRKHSGSVTMPVMTNQDVQQAVGASPSYVVTKHDHQIEVYAWTAGLPFRSHDLYVVYYKGDRNENLRFARHYKFVLPTDELNVDLGGPKLAAVQPAGPGPNPYEAVDHQASAPDREEPQAGSEAAEQAAEQSTEQSTVPAQAAETAP